LNPANPEALKLRGDVLYLLGRDSDAEQSLRKALEASPDHQASEYALARIYYQQNRFPDAIGLFQKLLQQDPNNYRAHDNLALCYSGLGRESDALKHFLKALDLVHTAHPEYDTVYANAANFFMQRGEHTKAFQLAAEAAKRNPGSARNFFLTGKALASLGKDDLSIRWFRQATGLDDTYAEPHYWLAKVYRNAGKTEDAARELEIFQELSKRPARRR
jgi:tetratricopeptide (TPR) repeat protein